MNDVGLHSIIDALALGRHWRFWSFGLKGVQVAWGGGGGGGGRGVGRFWELMPQGGGGGPRSKKRFLPVGRPRTI